MAKVTKLQKISSVAKSITATHRSPKRTPTRAVRRTPKSDSQVPPDGVSSAQVSSNDIEEIIDPPPSLNRDEIECDSSLTTRADTGNDTEEIIAPPSSLNRNVIGFDSSLNLVGQFSCQFSC